MMDATKRLGLAAAILTSMAGAGSQARAAMITYTETTVASGLLGGTAFNNQMITLTAIADSSKISGTSPFIFVINNSLTVAVPGIGTATFTDSTQTVASATSMGVDFESPAGFGSIVLGAFFNPVFTTYALTPLGPTSGTAAFQSTNFATTLGVFRLNTSANTATFQAVGTSSAVPEPSTIVLSGIGVLMGLAYPWSRLRARVVA